MRYAGPRLLWEGILWAGLCRANWDRRRIGTRRGLSNRGARRPLQLTRAALVTELQAARSPASAGSWGTNAAYPRPSHLCGSLLAPTLPTASPKPPRTRLAPALPATPPTPLRAPPRANPPRHNTHNFEHPATLPAAPSHPCGSRLSTTLPATPAERRVTPMLPAEPLHHCGLLVDPFLPQPSALLPLYSCGPSLVSSQSSLSRPSHPCGPHRALPRPSVTYHAQVDSTMTQLDLSSRTFAPRLSPRPHCLGK